MGDIIYTAEQDTAIRAVTDRDHRVVGVSGPAGSGKTTIIREAVKRLNGNGGSVALAAPTGRAARRMYEATGVKAVTVHRLLEYGKPIIDPNTGEPIDSPGPNRNSRNPLPYENIIVDEYAMVPWALHDNLIAALKPGARLLCFGDIAQLAPVEPHPIKTREGTPFEYVLTLRSAVELTFIHRQAEGSGILTNANRIRQGQLPVRGFDDFKVIYYSIAGKQPIPALKDFLMRSELDFTGLASQVITPARTGPIGSRALNNTIQSLYHGPEHLGYNLPRRISPKTDKSTKYACRVDVGEKVICNENTYDMRDFKQRYRDWRSEILPHWDSFITVPDEFMMLNGEAGIIQDIDPDGTLHIQMLDRVVHVPPRYLDYLYRSRTLGYKDPRETLDLAYAITTHKMQGNEVDDVCLILSRFISDQSTRNNIYTAITRARRSVTILTDDGALSSSIRKTAAMQQEIFERRKSQKKGWEI